MQALREIVHHFAELRRIHEEEMAIRNESLRRIWDKYQVPDIVSYAKDVFAPVEDWGVSNRDSSLKRPHLVHTLGEHYKYWWYPDADSTRMEEMTGAREVFQVGLSEAGFYIATKGRGFGFLGTTQTIPGYTELLALVDPHIRGSK